jgi:hypothetical protein
MTTDQVHKMLRARPFVPFTLHLADGRALRVNHPENAMVSDLGLSAAVLNPDGVIEIVDLLLVTSLRPVNGRSRSDRGKKKPR